MSKSKGNVIDPMDIKARYGTDALRFTLLSNVTKGQEMRLSEKDIEGSRKFLNKIWNATRFALLNLEDFSPEPGDDLASQTKTLPLKLEDRWMLSRLVRITEDVRSNLESYDFNVAAKGLYEFVWGELCDWYLELIKPRLLGSDSEDKRTAQTVLALALRETLKLLHPFIPFLTEELWQKLPAELGDAESVMIAPFPKARSEWRDGEAERAMSILQELIGAVRMIRSEMKVPPGVRADVFIRTEHPEVLGLCQEHERFFKDLARVEDLRVGPDVQRPSGAARRVLEYAEVFVPLEGLIDLDKQRDLLLRELEASKEELEKARRRLDNEDFLQKAPKDVVEKEKARAEELQAKIERIEENLSLLGAGSSSSSS